MPQQPSLFVELFMFLDNAMLKICTNESAGNLVTLQLEGQRIGTWISELNAAFEQLLSAGGKINFDLGCFFDRAARVHAPRITFEARGSTRPLLALSTGTTSNSKVVATWLTTLSAK